MTYLAIVSFLTLLVVPRGTVAQKADAWIQFSSETRDFSLSTPQQPKQQPIAGLKTNYGDLGLEGQLYEATSDGATYRLWALTIPHNAVRPEGNADAYLDGCAELTWEGLLKSERDALPDDRRVFARMTYVNELPAKPLPGREYTFTVDKLTGTMQCFVGKPRIYVLVVMGPVGGSWTREPFFSSFTLDSGLSVLPRAPSSIKSPDDLSDTEQVFKSSQVTERARVLDEPEPSHTESARIFSITGTVVLRAIFSSDGHVTNVVIMRRLPHGLTERAVKAAQAIRFAPATKDGKSVSMWMQLEYNFNLY